MADGDGQEGVDDATPVSDKELRTIAHRAAAQASAVTQFHDEVLGLREDVSSLTVAAHAAVEAATALRDDVGEVDRKRRLLTVPVIFSVLGVVLLIISSILNYKTLAKLNDVTGTSAQVQQAHSIACITDTLHRDSQRTGQLVLAGETQLVQALSTKPIPVVTIPIDPPLAGC